MTELEIDNHFSQSFGMLLMWLMEKGYQVRILEVYRPPVTAQYYKSVGKGIINSQHTKHRAGDLALFMRGAMLISKEDYAPAGEYWKSLSSNGLPHRWGGDFMKKKEDGTIVPSPDSDHFSIETNGVK